MGVYRRPDSTYWWLHLETAPKGRRRVASHVLIGDAEQEAGSLKEAQRAYYNRMGELAREVEGLPAKKESIALAAFATWFDQNVVAHHRGAVREREILARLVRDLGHLDLSAITADVVIAWRTRRRTTPVTIAHHGGPKGKPRTLPPASERTVNREIDVLKQLLSAAVPKYLKASPIAGLKRLAGKRPRRRLLSPDEETRLLKVATGAQDRALIILGIDTLMRMGDLLNLQRSHRRGVWLYVEHPKGGEPYEVPLSPRAGAALDAIPHEKNQPYFFGKFRRAERPRDWRSSVRQRLERLCAEADPPIPFGRAQGGITFHWATRRTGATRLLVDKLQSVPVVQQIGNWRKPDVLLEIYAEAQRSDLLAAVGAFTSRSRDVTIGKKSGKKRG